MELCVVYCNDSSPLKATTAELLLEDVDLERVSVVAPKQPQNGDVYIYKVDSAESSQDLMNDGFSWKDDRSSNVSECLVAKSFHIKDKHGKPSRDFFKTVYRSNENADMTLVQYLGDCTQFENDLKNEKIDEVVIEEEAPKTPSDTSEESVPVVSPGTKDETLKDQQKKAIIYDETKKTTVSFPYLAAFNILNDFDICKLSPVAPVRPQPGSLYVYKMKNSKAKTWIKDGYTWLNQGKRNIPIKDSVMCMVYYRRSSTDDQDCVVNFMRHVYYLQMDPLVVLVHYLADKPTKKAQRVTLTVKKASPVKEFVVTKLQRMLGNREVKKVIDVTRVKMLQADEASSSSPVREYTPSDAADARSFLKRSKRVREQNALKSSDALDSSSSPSQAKKPRHTTAVYEKVKTKVLAHRNTKMTNKEALALLQGIGPKKFSKAPPCKPVSGELYAFRSETSVNNDWVNDGLLWYDRGIQQLRIKNTIMVIMLFELNTPAGEKARNFKKHVYFALNNPLDVLLHYLGDESDHETESDSMCEERIETDDEEETEVFKMPELFKMPEALDDSFEDCKKHNGAILYARRIPSFSNREALEILENAKKERISEIAPHRPIGGEVYIFKFSNTATFWKRDGYPGWLNFGSNKYPKGKPSLTKSYHYYCEKNCEHVKEFSKHVYRLVHEPYYVMVHYIGCCPVKMPKTSVANVKKEIDDNGDGGNQEQVEIEGFEEFKEQSLAEKLRDDETPPETKLNGAVVYGRVKPSLKIEDARDILMNINLDKMSTIIASQPSGDELYIYKFENLEKEEWWRQDNYKWLHAGQKPLPQKNPQVLKSYFQYYPQGGKPTKSFMRHAYRLIHDHSVALVHYCGITPSSELQSNVILSSPTAKKIPQSPRRSEWKTAILQRRMKIDSGEIIETPEEADGAQAENPDQLQANLYATAEDGLSIPIVQQLIEEVDSSRVSEVPAYRPTHGQIFIYKFDSLKRAKDWTCDSYLWISDGNRKFPKHSPNPKMVKSYFQIRGEGGAKDPSFVRHAYHLLADPLTVLVHYLGDHSKFVPRTHGNRKHENVEHIRTCPSTLAALREQSEKMMPCELYKMMTGMAKLPTAMTPRDIKQVRNIRSQVNAQAHRVAKAAAQEEETSPAKKVEVQEEQVSDVWELLTLNVSSAAEIEVEMDGTSEAICEDPSPLPPSPKKKKKPGPKNTTKHDCLANFSGLSFKGTGNANAYISRVEAAGRLMGYKDNRLVDIVLMTISDDVFSEWYDPVSQPGKSPGDLYSWEQWKDYFLSKYRQIPFETQ